MKKWSIKITPYDDVPQFVDSYGDTAPSVFAEGSWLFIFLTDKSGVDEKLVLSAPMAQAVAVKEIADADA